ncbi:MAG: hypothetical protein IV104_04430 [Acidovorax sp.]|nr:hypothetical protein [Acidovorax sp.]
MGIVLASEKSLKRKRAAGIKALGMLFTHHRAVCICGLGRSAALQMLAIATAIAALCALQPIPIPSAHFPLDS